MFNPNLDDYKSTIPYKTKYDFETVFVYQRGKLIYQGTDKECKNTLGDNYQKIYIIEKFEDDEAFKKYRLEYNVEDTRLYNKFKQDLFEYYEVSNNPKKDLCFSLAWEHGHSEGYPSIIVWFDELVDLII